MSDGVRRTVDSRSKSVAVIEPDWRTRLLGTVTAPTVAYLWLLLGIYGIYFELTSPGFGVPGVAGLIALLLGMFALQMLPVSYAGAALIVLGFAMLVAEALLPSFGALGIGGTIAFIIGSIMLIDTDTPGFGIPIGLIVTVAVVSGAEELPGATGEILEASADAAWMRLHGERWRVRSAAPLLRG